MFSRLTKTLISVYNLAMNKWYHLDKHHIQNPVQCEGYLLYQTGRIFCDEHYLVDEHSHLEWIELTVVTDGLGKVSANGIAVPVKKGDVFVSFPCDTHQVISSPDNPLKFDFLTYFPTDENMLASLETLFPKFAPAQSRIISGQKIAPLVQEIIAEADSNGLFSQKLIGSLLQQISIHIIRCFENAESVMQKTSVTQLCYSIMNYIDTHIFSISSLGDLENVSGYNYSYLSALFHDVCGQTLSSYFRHARLNGARRLIGEKTLTLTEIATLLGYSSLYSFSKAYKAYFGISPSFDNK